MRFGKREQIVVLFLGTALLIFLVHLLIFQPRATEYARISKEFQDGVATLRDTEQPQSPKQLEDFNARTAKYEKEVTSLVEELRLTVPKHYARLGTESVHLRMKDTLDAMRELVKMRKEVKTPQLTFLDDKKDAAGTQQGWNIPAELSERTLGVKGAIWDIVSQLLQRWDTMSLVTTPLDKLRHRFYYNQQLPQIGLPPQEVCDWVVGVPGLGWVFFNDRDLKDQLVKFTRGGMMQLQLDVRPNPFSINRFGPLLPVFKRLWVAELVWEKRDPNTQISKEQLFEALEVYPKYYPTDHAIVVANKELQALVDIVKLAQKHGILEISKVALLKFTPVEKAVRRVPGATPTPEASPAAPAAGPQPGVLGFDAGLAEPGMMAGRPGGMPGMPAAVVPTPDEKNAIGAAGGLELEMRAYNANLIKFLFELTHSPRTYAVDDLYIYADPKGELRTTMTVELVTNLNALKD
ncbi:MAG: hypothetical protein N2Z21_07920 [Candidatus Sumerlaeaceae bacterium]|nr:hypothetical protein [Candidatus Sumerlaeaceae bacterium]